MSSVYHVYMLSASKEMLACAACPPLVSCSISVGLVLLLQLDPRACLPPNMRFDCHHMSSSCSCFLRKLICYGKFWSEPIQPADYVATVHLAVPAAASTAPPWRSTPAGATPARRPHGRRGITRLRPSLTGKASAMQSAISFSSNSRPLPSSAQNAQPASRWP